MFFKRRPKFNIDSKQTLEEAALKFGILPFFSNPVKGLSVYEMTTPGLLFGGNIDEGCWEWKGPVLRHKTLAYGKFFRRKAGFVSLELLPDFINYRRGIYPVKPDSTEEMLLEIIRENDSMTSTELKSYIFGSRSKTRKWNDLPEMDIPIIEEPKHKSLEGPLQRLQMSGRLLIADFEYKRTKKGERYGWGVARYSTPELHFSDKLVKLKEMTPEESLESLIRSMKRVWPVATKDQLLSLLR